MRGRVLRGLAALALASLLSGCSMPELVSSPEDLYSLPALPAKYTELNQQINAILAGDAEYAAPASGTNIQSVQLVDLDGNGGEEAVKAYRTFLTLGGSMSPIEELKVAGVDMSTPEPVVSALDTFAELLADFSEMQQA